MSLPVRPSTFRFPARHLPAVVLLAAGPASTALAGVEFRFNYLDPDGVGFRAEGDTGVQRRATLERAGGYLSGVLSPDYTSTVVLDVSGAETDDDTLASAATYYSVAEVSPGFDLMGDVQTKILFGDDADPDPEGADGVVDWNFEDFSWQGGTDFAPGEQDLLSTAIHELTHALGFASEITEAGESLDGDPAGTPAAWTPFDAYVADGDGEYVIDDDAVLDAVLWAEASVGGAGEGGLTFAGPEAVEANGGELVFLYSPEVWEDGSSGSHLDDEVYDGLDGAAAYLMNSSSQFEEGKEIRFLSAVELGILRDLGYRTSAGTGGGAAVPTPAALPAGLVLLAGLTGRRRSA